jgi:hypothetical protein
LLRHETSYRYRLIRKPIGRPSRAQKAFTEWLVARADSFRQEAAAFLDASAA